MLDPRQPWQSLPAAVRRFDPLALMRNPVMFVTEVGAMLTSGITFTRPRLFG